LLGAKHLAGADKTNGRAETLRIFDAEHVAGGLLGIEVDHQQRVPVRRRPLIDRRQVTCPLLPPITCAVQRVQGSAVQSGVGDLHHPALGVGCWRDGKTDPQRLTLLQRVDASWQGRLPVNVCRRGKLFRRPLGIFVDPVVAPVGQSNGLPQYVQFNGGT
jgi:hypothetical protein